MVKILAVSDIHENIEKVDSIISRLINFDVLLLAGDITELRIMDFYRLLRRLKEKDKKIIAISGNHDCVLCLEKLAKKLDNFVYIYRGLRKLEFDDREVNILAISGIYKRNKSDMLYFDNRTLLKIYRKALEDEVDIVISHVPPYHCSDFLPKGGRGGLKQLLLLMDALEPRFWFSGHTHVIATEKRSDTICINCGLAYIGDFALVDYDSGDIIMGRYIDKSFEFISEPADWDFLYYLRRTRSYRRVLWEVEELLVDAKNKKHRTIP